MFASTASAALESAASPFLQAGTLDNLCDGSRRPVRGERHKLKTSPSGHMNAICPVCKRKVTVKRVLGVVEFTRHAKE